MAISQGPTASIVAGNAGAAPLVAAGTVPSEAKSGSGMRFTLLINQPSSVATSNWTAESTSPPKSGFSGVKRPGSCRKLAMERVPKAITKPEKAGRPSKIVPSSEEIKIKIPVASSAALTAGASTRASSIQEVSVMEVEVECALLISFRFASGQHGYSRL